MNRGDKVIYDQVSGKFKKIAEARLPGNANFVILWRGRDWSGFRTLAECEKQFPELEARNDAQQNDFCVVER